MTLKPKQIYAYAGTKASNRVYVLLVGDTCTCINTLILFAYSVPYIKSVRNNSVNTVQL